MFLEAITTGLAIDKVLRALKSARALLNTEEFKSLVAQSTALENVQKQLREAEIALRDTGFPYTRQFKPISEQALAPVPKSTKKQSFVTEWVHASRVSYDPNIWQSVELPDGLLADWFDLDALAKLPGADTIEKEWAALYSGAARVWKAKQTSHNLTISGHKYIKQMYPFIALTCVASATIAGKNDPRIYLINLFLSWLNRLCSDDLETKFTVEKLFVSAEYAYISGKFSFTGITVSHSGKKVARSCYLDRKMIVGTDGETLYIVMTGSPMKSRGDIAYLDHASAWLEQFQITRSGAPVA